MAAPITVASIHPVPAETASPPEHALHPLARIRSHSRAGAVLSDDGLDTYMSQVRRVEVLSRDEQDELARAYVDDGDVEAGKTLIWTNLRLVIKIARQFHRSGQELMELIQEGNLGLSEALIRFEPEQGTPFIGYAHFWIRAMILNHLLNLSQPVRLGNSRDSRKLFFNLNKARRSLLDQGMEPTAENVARYLEVDVDEVVRVATLMDDGGIVHLDAPRFGEDDGATAMDFIEYSGDSPEQAASQRMAHRRLMELAEEFAQTLPDERRVTIWNERVLAADPRYLKDLAAQYDVSKERIRQLEQDILRRFRLYLERKLGGEVEAFVEAI